MAETAIQSEILAWLKARGVWHRRLPVGAVKHGGVRKKSPLKGMPDIFGIIPNSAGRLFMIEVKDKSRLSPEQTQVIGELEAEGVLVIVAHSLNDVQTILLRFPVAI